MELNRLSGALGATSPMLDDRCSPMIYIFRKIQTKSPAIASYVQVKGQIHSPQYLPPLEPLEGRDYLQFTHHLPIQESQIHPPCQVSH